MRINLRRTMAAVLLVTAAGCSVGPKYQPPTTKLAPAWLEAEGDGFDLSSAVLAQWWREFDDPQLHQLIERALAANLDVAVAAARLREARAFLASADAAFYPAVDIEGSYGRSRSSSNSFSGNGQNGGTAAGQPRDLFKAGFDAGWEIDLFGAIGRRSEAARADVDAAVEDRRAVLVSLLGDVAKNYIDLRASQRRLAVAQDNLRNQRETLHLTRVRFDAGLASALDVAQAEGLAQSTAAQVPALSGAIMQAQYQLDLLLGAQPGAESRSLSQAAPIPALPSKAQVGLPAELLRRRPDIRRAERQLAAASARVGAAVADLYPKLSLTGSFGWQSISAADWLTGPSRFWSIGPTIRWPLFDAGRLRAAVEIRSAQQEQALLLYEKSVLSALSEVETALVNYRTEQERYRALLAALAASRDAVALAEDLYRQGIVPFLNVLDGQRTLLESESALASSEAALAANLVALYKALGGGWETP